MRLFQNFGVYPAYRPRLEKLIDGKPHFRDQIEAILNDGYGANHILHPVQHRSKDAFFTLADTETVQRQWAKEKGLKADIALDEIFLAQIEDHKTDVLYNLDPVRYDDDFITRLPGCVKKVIGWRAAPGAEKFKKYDLIVSNFPNIREFYREKGIRTAELYPSHSPLFDDYVSKNDRDIDILFYGGYSRHHQRRAQILEAVAEMSGDYNISFHFDVSRATKLAETPLGWFGPLSKLKRPQSIREVTRSAIFGCEVFEQISRAKIVLNAAVDIAGDYRGNMRCFEAMGAGALLVSDAGIYPNGMIPGKTMLTYQSPEDVAGIIRSALETFDKTGQKIAKSGYNAMKKHYSKANVYNDFLKLL